MSPAVPRGTGRVLKLAERLRAHSDAPARHLRRDVVSVADHHRVDEVLVQVLDVLENPVLERAAHRDVIKERDVLHILAESDAAGVRADRNAELRRHEEDCKYLVESPQAAAVELAEPDGLRLKELLEHDTVLAVLAGRDRDRRDRTRDGGMAENVVGARRLLDPVGLEL